MNLYKESYILNLISILIAIIILVKNRKYIFHNIPSNNNSDYWLLGIFITAFSLLYRVGYDFIGHQLQIENYIHDDYYTLHMEDFYYWLVDHITTDYLLWRTIVWGLSAILLVKCFKALKADSKLALCLFIMIALLPAFYYLRNCLAFGFLYLGVILYTQNREQTIFSIKNILILILIICSLQTHKTTPLYLLISILGLVIPLNKKTIIISIILFPFLYVMTKEIGSELLSFTSLNEETLTYGNAYLETTNTTGVTFFGYIGLIIVKFPSIYLLWHAIKGVISNKEKVTYTEKTLLMITYIIVYISFLLKFNVDAIVDGRISNSATYPMALYAVCYLKNKRTSKINHIYIYSIIISYLYSTLLRLQ